MDAETPEVLFRPVKRQKFIRKRADESTDIQTSSQPLDQHDTSQTRDKSSPVGDLEEISENGVSGVVRLRKPHRPRRGGIEFTTNSKQNLDNKLHPGMSTEDTEVDIIRAKFDRFTAHTGQKVDVDKHMMEYIESELARRQDRDNTAESTTMDARENQQNVNRTQEKFSLRDPAALGKLHEIDLGQETKLQNIARTEAATRRLAGNRSPSPDDEAASQTTRLGKDGKPWRGRRRRNSEDIERDRLVEEVLRESKLDVYDEPEQEGSLDGQAADDRIAEQFRRDFLEAIQSRRRAARPKANNKVTKPEVPRGPKLGGSRSARAAMREMREKGGQK